VATRPELAWCEIHPENFIANPHATELLSDLARSYPLSLHTVGLSVLQRHRHRSKAPGKSAGAD
jgi:uncharacterized protein (UPF0276 family)